MQAKLKKLFKEINFDNLSSFEDASIEKVVIYDNNKLLDFVVATNEVLPLDIYDELLSKLISYFSTVENVKLIIRPKNIDYNIIKDYFLTSITDLPPM